MGAQCLYGGLCRNADPIGWIGGQAWAQESIFSRRYAFPGFLGVLRAGTGRGMAGLRARYSGHRRSSAYPSFAVVVAGCISRSPACLGGQFMGSSGRLGCGGRPQHRFVRHRRTWLAMGVLSEPALGNHFHMARYRRVDGIQQGNDETLPGSCRHGSAGHWNRKRCAIRRPG